MKIRLLKQWGDAPPGTTMNADPWTVVNLLGWQACELIPEDETAAVGPEAETAILPAPRVTEAPSARSLVN